MSDGKTWSRVIGTCWPWAASSAPETLEFRQQQNHLLDDLIDHDKNLITEGSHGEEVIVESAVGSILVEHKENS